MVKKFESFEQDISTFVNSIIFKHSNFALHVNNILDDSKAIKRSYNPKDKTTWKYYMNLAGEYYVTDEKIVFIDPTTDETLTLTKTLLKAKPYLSDLITTDTTLSKYLKAEYPSQISTIVGMVTNKTIKEVVDLPDLSILYYNKDVLVNHNEEYISFIEKRLKYYMDTFYNKYSYFYRPTYVNTFVNVLNSCLINDLRDYVLKTINTYRVNDFFINHKLESNSMRVTHLSKHVKYRLYKSIDSLVNNKGSVKTVDYIKTLAKEDGVNIEDVELIKTLPLVTKKLYNEYKLQNNIFVTDTTTMNIDSLLKTTITDNDDAHKLAYINDVIEKSKHMVNNKNKTAYLNLDSKTSHKLHNYLNLTTIVDIVIHMLSVQSLYFKLLFKHPKLGTVISMTSSQLIEFILQLLAQITNTTVPSTVKLPSVLGPRVRYDVKYQETKPYVDLLEKLRPADLSSKSNQAKLKSFILAYDNFFTTYQFLYNNVMKDTVRTDLKLYLDSVFVTKTVTINLSNNNTAIQAILDHAKTRPLKDKMLSIITNLNSLIGYEVLSGGLDDLGAEFKNIIDHLGSYRTGVVINQKSENNAIATIDVDIDNDVNITEKIIDTVFRYQCYEKFTGELVERGAKNDEFLSLAYNGYKYNVLIHKTEDTVLGVRKLEDMNVSVDKRIRVKILK